MAERPVRGGRVTRTAPLVGLAGRTAGEAVVASLRRRLGGADTTEEAHARAAERYAERLGNAKGVLMKAGQLLSFVSAAADARYQPLYQRAMERLQDDAPPMPYETAAAMVTAELGAAPEELFAEFEPEPIAAASIGQVHRATTRDGRRVAVKVQYPGVEQAIRADLANTELLSTFFQLVKGMTPMNVRMDVRAMAREVAERIGEEIDYRTEAAHQREFAGYYRGHPFIRIPEIVDELSARRVLTMDLSDGMRWRQARETEDDGLRQSWGEAVYRFYLGSLRRLHVFNADPHPGNLLFHDDGTVTFLDFGCVKHYSPELVHTLVRSVQAAVDQDADRLLAVLTEGGQIDPADPPTKESALAWYSTSLRPLLSAAPFTYTPEFAAEVVREDYRPGEFTRKGSPSADMVTLSRIDLGMTFVLGGLLAGNDWEGIRREWDCGGPPATPMGELDVAFWAGAHVG